MFSFQGASESLQSRDSMKLLVSKELQSISYLFTIHYYLLLKKWWAKMDSNHRPHDYQSCALASWAIGPYQLHFFLWWRLAGSNRWPPACKAGALPAELNPHIHLFWFWSGGPKWTRFSAEKPRRLQQSTGLLPSAGFRVLSATQAPSLVRILCPFLWSGGPKWTRTIDLTIISRVL